MTSNSAAGSVTAFLGHRRLATGSTAEVAGQIKRVLRPGEVEPLIFDDLTGRPVEIDLRGTTDEVLARLKAGESAASSGSPARVARRRRSPGRPRLGVVGREVTLLPRHWAWLNQQPGGASVTLRKLVEAARRGDGEGGRRRQGQEAAYRFMVATAGNLPGFEEATRALFAGNRSAFEEHTSVWPVDLANYARSLAASAF